MKQILLLFLLLVAVIVFTAWFSRSNVTLNFGGSPQVSPSPASSANLVKIGGGVITVDIADSPEELEAGLGGRDSLGSDEGMLFVVKKDSRPIFWMKNMRFPIDIIWVNDGTVSEIHQNVAVPQPNTPNSALIRYRPQRVIDYVVEVEAGFTQNNNIKVGDTVQLPLSLQ